VPTSNSTHETFLGLDRFLLQRFGSPIHHLVKIAPEGHAPPFPATDLENTGGDPPQCGKSASGRAEAASAYGKGSSLLQPPGGGWASLQAPSLP
jgi:hypothetical protein